MELLKKIKNYKASDWYTENTPSRPLLISGIARGFTSGTEIKVYELVLCYFKEDKLTWVTLIKDQLAIGKLIVDKQLVDKKFWPAALVKYLKIKNDLAANFKILKDKDLSGVDNQSLVADIKKYVKLQWETRKYDSLVDPYIFYAEKRLPELLTDFIADNPEINFNPNEATEIITKPEDSSFLNDYELDLIAIAREIAKDQDLKEQIIEQKISEADLKDLNVYQQIKNHLSNFCWIKVESFFGAKAYTFNDVLEKITDLLQVNLDEEEKKNNIWQVNKDLRNNYLSKYKFNEEILAYVALAPLFGEWQDLRKINSVMTTFLHSKYLTELSKRTGVNEDELAYLDYSEIEDLLNGKINEAKLQKRKQGVLMIFNEAGITRLYGNEANDIMAKINEPEKKRLKEFSGVIACAGLASGPVKIVIRVEDIPKVKSGDVLVSTMTRPEHMPAMKKASAIITDEGGITCHAAIISRELGIPCIIGTKIATQILHNGDEVEVDANKGIVKIITNNQ